MKIIVITGKSGSGKTYVASHIANILNAKHLTLDKISHKTLELNELKNFARAEFGNSVFDENGNIDRKKMGALAFSNPEKLQKLNQLAEIEMEKIIDNEINSFDGEFLILDYMLLPLMKYFEMANIKILVTSETETRKQRILNRDGISEEYFLSRESHSLEFNPQRYDIVINNNDPIDFENIAQKIKAGI